MATPPSKLAQIINQPAQASAAAPRPSGSKLGAILTNGRRGEDVVLPLLGSVRMELIGQLESQTVESELLRAMAALTIDRNFMTADRYELERATRTLARAVRDPADRSQPFGSIEDWQQLDNDTINTAWLVYGDVRERLDPVEFPLSDEDRIAIEIAVKKKDAMLLRTYGTVKLSAWLASTDVLPSTSRPPSSPSSGSSSDF